MSAGDTSSALPRDIIRKLDRLMKVGREFHGGLNGLKMFSFGPPEDLTNKVEKPLAEAAILLWDALSAIGSEDFERLSPLTQNGINGVSRLFKQFIDSCKWDKVIAPDGSKYVADRMEWFRVHVQLPHERAILSYANGLLRKGEDVDEALLREATRLKKSGTPADMPFDEAARYCEESPHRADHTPIFGEAMPKCTVGFCDEFDSYLKKIIAGYMEQKAILDLSEAETAGHVIDVGAPPKGVAAGGTGSETETDRPPLKPQKGTAPVEPAKQNPIPRERRTRPMTLSEAARFMGLSGSKPGEQLKRQIDAGRAVAHKLSRQSYVFDVNDFPGSVQEKIRPAG
jgi:hypothetical protein